MTSFFVITPSSRLKKKLQKQRYNFLIKIINNQLLTDPLCVTRTCRRPSFLNMSITVSIGVWSVTVMGARSSIRRSLTGEWIEVPLFRPALNRTNELSVTSSCLRRALPRARIKSRRKTDPTRKHDSWETTTGKALCFVLFSIVSTSPTVIDSSVMTVKGALPLRIGKKKGEVNEKSIEDQRYLGCMASAAMVVQPNSSLLSRKGYPLRAMWAS